MKVTDSPAGVARLIGDVAAEPSLVYDYFTDEDRLVRWWAEQATTDVRIDGEYELAWPSQDRRLLGTYVVVEPGTRLAFTWAFAHEALHPSTVDIQFSPIVVGTELTIEHSHGDDPDERQGYIDGWKFFIGRLRDAVAAG